jgi:hypothetical protein
LISWVIFKFPVEFNRNFFRFYSINFEFCWYCFNEASILNWQCNLLFKKAYMIYITSPFRMDSCSDSLASFSVSGSFGLFHVWAFSELSLYWVPTELIRTDF